MDHMKSEQVDIKPPNISDETMKEMAKFFMKTSIPRIVKEKQISRKGGEK